jgi:hypothetical protein
LTSVLAPSNDLFHWTLPVETTFTYHTTPQIQVAMDGFNIICEDCTFSYDSAPAVVREITGVSVDSATSEVVLTGTDLN